MGPHLGQLEDALQGVAQRAVPLGGIHQQSELPHCAAMSRNCTCQSRCRASAERARVSAEDIGPASLLCRSWHVSVCAPVQPGVLCSRGGIFKDSLAHRAHHRDIIPNNICQLQKWVPLVQSCHETAQLSDALVQFGIRLCSMAERLLAPDLQALNPRAVHHPLTIPDTTGIFLCFVDRSCTRTPYRMINHSISYYPPFRSKDAK